MMKRALMIAPPLLGGVALLAAVNTFYSIGQAQQVVLLRLGRPIVAVNDGPTSTAAGLHLKWPFIEQVQRLDRRTLTLQTPSVERPARAAPVSFRAEMRYRVDDPLRFYRALGDERQGEQRLSQLLDDSLERGLSGIGAHDMAKASAALDEGLAADMRSKAAKLGLNILDVRLVDASPSPSTIDALSRKMQEVEGRQVAQIKSDGEQHKRDLLAQADRDAADVRGEGDRRALEMRGDGDGQRAAILGVAYGKDPAFARFFRRLEAYDQAFNPDNTVLVLSQENAFLDLFAHGPGDNAQAHR